MVTCYHVKKLSLHCVCCLQEPTARPRFMQEPERQKDVIDGSNSDEVQPLISPLTHTSDSFVTAPQSLDTVVEADESSLCKSESVSGGLASTSMGAENESLRDDESEVWKSESGEMHVGYGRKYSK